MAIIFLNTYFLEDLWDIVYLSQSDSGDFNSKGLSHKKPLDYPFLNSFYGLCWCVQKHDCYTWV